MIGIPVRTWIGAILFSVLCWCAIFYGVGWLLAWAVPQ